jgi:AbrB family looped-hinge helix DNA binding protein
MKELIATVTKRGQVTIPVEVQRTLDLHPGDKVRFIISDHEVQLALATFTLASVRGSVEPLSEYADDLDFSEQIAIAKEERAHRMLSKLKQS